MCNVICETRLNVIQYVGTIRSLEYIYMYSTFICTPHWCLQRAHSLPNHYTSILDRVELEPLRPYRSATSKSDELRKWLRRTTSVKHSWIRSLRVPDSHRVVGLLRHRSLTCADLSWLFLKLIYESFATYLVEHKGYDKDLLNLTPATWDFWWVGSSGFPIPREES